MITAKSGPDIVYGQRNALGTGAAGSNNSDVAPSASFAGRAWVDPRAGYNVTRAGAIILGGDLPLIDQAPSTLGVVAIAAAQNVTIATPLTLVSSSAAGITVMTSALTIPQTGNVVPSGSLCIDALPTLTTFGLSGKIAMQTVATTMARAVAIAAAASAVGCNMTVVGYDLYGYPQTETIAVAAGAATTNGKKGWKFITSITPDATDAHNYSVGCADIFEFPVRVDALGYVRGTWNNIFLASPTFVAADATTATATTGSVRGTMVPATASDGTKRLVLFGSIKPANALTAAGMFGVVPA